MADTVDTSVAASPSASGAPAAASPAATATPAGPAKGAVSSGTASEAMIAAAMAASQADEKKPDATGAASAVVAAEAKSQTGADGKPVAGVPPEDRWPSILENARTKAAEEAIKPYAWAKGIKVEDASAALTLLQSLRHDPKALWRELGERIGAEVAPAKVEEFPTADLVTADGAKAHSDANLSKILDIFERRLMTKFQGELRPLMEFRDGEVETRTHTQTVAKAKELAGQALTDARSRPHFKENEPAIVEILTKMDPAIKKSVGPIAAMYMAYNQMLAEKVFPTIDTTAAEKVRAENLKKANAGGIHPSGGDGKPAEKPVLRNQNDLAAHMSRLESSADPRFTSV